MILSNDKKVIVLLHVPVYSMSFNVPLGSPSDGEISFLDLLFHHVPNRAQNGNQGLILAYPLFWRFMVTGLMGAFLILYFPITGIRAWNQKSPVLLAEKPALLFPIGWQIVFRMGWSSGNERKVCCTLWFLWIRVRDKKRLYSRCRRGIERYYRRGIRGNG
jgi:hypothetical protein